MNPLDGKSDRLDEQVRCPKLAGKPTHISFVSACWMYELCPVQKIVSGGQTGVDRAALDAAMFLGLEHGGWCPRHRRAEDGRISERYHLSETQASDYSVRTEKNVLDSDGTLVLFRKRPTGGTALTVKFLKQHQRPCWLIDLTQEHDYGKVRNWLESHRIVVLNIAGPRESSQPGIAQEAEQLLVNVFQGY